MYRLRNGLKNYDWGSAHAIPSFIGDAAGGQPVAEMWVGTHPLSPSTAIDEAGGEHELTELTGDLPFLLKLLAADRPLSLQLHPNKAFAEQGFAAEEAAGIPIDAPNRVYKDANHKPEMAYALTTFDSLVGFRPTAEILRVLTPINTHLTRALVVELQLDPGFRGIVRLVETLLLSEVRDGEVRAVVARCQELLDAGVDVKRAYQSATEIAEYYPDDVGVVIALMLNRVTLQPGEAAYLEAGVIHAHLKGLCVEIMATSDNVLRAGLTSKHIDPKGLVQCLDYGMSRLARVTPDYVTFSTELFAPSGVEFALAVTQVSGADPDGIDLLPVGRQLIMCTGGSVSLRSAAGGEIALGRGESVYVPAEDGQIVLCGVGEVAQAFEPTSHEPQSELIDLA